MARRTDIDKYMAHFGFVCTLRSANNAYIIYRKDNIDVTVTINKDSIMYQASCFLATIITAQTIKSTDFILVLKQASVLCGIEAVVDDGHKLGLFALNSKEDTLKEWLVNGDQES